MEKGRSSFAPKPRSYRYSLPKKVRRLAMKSALSSKVNEEAILVLDSLELKEAKTKEMAKVLDNFNINKKALIVLEGKNETVERAACNIPGVKLAYVNTLNVLDILNYDNFVITQDAVKKVEEVYV